MRTGLGAPSLTGQTPRPCYSVGELGRELTVL